MISLLGFNVLSLLMCPTGGCGLLYEKAWQRDGRLCAEEAGRAAPEIQIHGAQPVPEETQVTPTKRDFTYSRKISWNWCLITEKTRPSY